MDKKAEYGAYSEWAFKKEGEAVGRMHGNDAAWAGWEARALLAASTASDKQEAVRDALEQSNRVLDSLRYERQPVWKLERQIERNKEALAAPPDKSASDAQPKLCTICDGYGRYQDGNSGTEADGYAPNIVECECAPEERLPAPRSAVHPDDVAVDQFAKAMKDKLADARAKGRGGWQECSIGELSRMLRDHVEKGDPRDVANFCMFLWHLKVPILQSEEHEDDAQPVAKITGADEYGPMIEWTTHWVDLVGKSLYLKEPE